MAGRVRRGRAAGMGAMAAPAGISADPARLPAARAGLLGLLPAFAPRALAAQHPAGPADLVAAADAGPRAQHAPASGGVEGLILAAVRAGLLVRPVSNRVVTAGAVLASGDADRAPAADAVADPDCHRDLRCSDRRHRASPGGPWLAGGSTPGCRDRHRRTLHRSGVDVE